VQFLLHRKQPEHGEGLFPQYLSLMSQHPVLSMLTWANQTKVKFVQFRELIAGQLKYSLSLSLSLSLYLNFNLYLTHTLSLCHTHSHTHTHTLRVVRSVYPLE
jgi:hypothetical protein